MNIIEVIKSGKPFKRKNHHPNNYLISNEHNIIMQNNNGLIFTVGLCDILADDWEIQEKTIQITESQFDEAWEKIGSDSTYGLDELYKEFKEILGF